MRYHTNTLIAAPAETVWAVLTDAAAYPAWTTTVTGVDGAIALDAKITVKAAIANGRGFPVRVTRLDAPRLMEWTGGMPLGLFRGVRRFSLSPEAGGTRFAMEETFSGPMLALMRGSMPDLQPSFDAFASDLKRAAEAG